MLNSLNYPYKLLKYAMDKVHDNKKETPNCITKLFVPQVDSIGGSITNEIQNITKNIPSKCLRSSVGRALDS